MPALASLGSEVLDHLPDDLGSTARRESCVFVDVRLGLASRSVDRLSSPISFRVSVSDRQTIERLHLSWPSPRQRGLAATMARELKEAPQRAPIDDSSSVVLHARRTTFVMLIVSALVVVGILAEDVARLKRAVDDAEIVRGLMNLWHTETRDKDGPISVPHILAGPQPKHRTQRGHSDWGSYPAAILRATLSLCVRSTLTLASASMCPRRDRSGKYWCGQATNLSLAVKSTLSSGSFRANHYGPSGLLNNRHTTLRAIPGSGICCDRAAVVRVLIPQALTEI